MRENSETAGDVDATVGIVDGRVAMSADVETDLAVKWPDHTPLSEHETVATLRVADDDVRVEVELNPSALDGLVDALHHAQEGTAPGETTREEP